MASGVKDSEYMRKLGEKTQWKPGQSGNGGVGPGKGYKHINTIVQELMNDDEFQATIQEGYKIVNFKGAPAKAIVKAQMLKAINGDTNAYKALIDSGWTKKTENENKITLVNPIMSLEESNALLGDNSHS